MNPKIDIDSEALDFCNATIAVNPYSHILSNIQDEMIEAVATYYSVSQSFLNPFVNGLAINVKAS